MIQKQNRRYKNLLFFIFFTMKRFKTKRRTNKKRMYLFLALVILSLILFIWISFKRLNKSYYSLVDLFIYNTNFETKKQQIIKHNLDYMITTYHFMDKEIHSHFSKKIVYLYNTHDEEKYQDNSTVIDASNNLKKKLQKLGISTIVEEKKVSDYRISGTSEYDISRNFIQEIMKTNEIALFLDIHRDSVHDTKIKIQDKNYAKVLFVLGLANPNYEKNKENYVKMQEYLEKKYKGLCKGILEKKGSNVNGVYNQDLNSNILLIEIGGVDNTQEEIINTTEALALTIYNILQEKENN